MMRKKHQTHTDPSSSALNSEYQKLWNKNVSQTSSSASLNNLCKKDDDEPAPLFDEAQFCLNDYYKFSSNRRLSRRNFVDSFVSDSFNEKSSREKCLNEKGLMENRVKSWFGDPCYHFNSTDRIAQLIKSKAGARQSVENRFKMYHRSNDYKLQKANNNSSIEMIESLAKKNSALIQDFKRKFL